MKSFPTEVTLDYKAIEECEQFTTKNPWSAMCKRAIWDRLLQYNFEFRRGNKRIRPKKKYVRRVNIALHDACKEIMTSLINYGVVPVSLKHTDGGIPVPKIPRGEGFIKTMEDPIRDVQVFKYYRINNGQGGTVEKFDKKVKVFIDKGYEPDKKGKIRSIIATALDDIRTSTQLKELAMQAEERNCLPEKVIEPTSLSQTETEVNVMKLGDRISIKKKQEDMKTLTKAEAEAVRYQEQEVARVYSQMYAASGYNPGVGPGYKPIPSAYRLVHQVTPKPRGDLLEFMKMNQDTVCSLYGVPKSILTDSGSRSAYSGVQANIDTFNNTILSWRKKLSDILTEIFQHIYNDTDIGALDQEGLLKFSDVFKVTDADGGGKKKRGASGKLKKKTKPKSVKRQKTGKEGRKKTKKAKKNGNGKEEEEEKEENDESSSESEESSSSSSESESSSSEEDEMYASSGGDDEDDNTISVIIPFVPYETQQGLVEKLALGLIDDNTFATYSRRISFLPEDDYEDIGNKSGMAKLTSNKQGLLETVRSTLLEGTFLSGNNGQVAQGESTSQDGKSKSKKRKKKDTKKEDKEKDEEEQDKEATKDSKESESGKKAKEKETQAKERDKAKEAKGGKDSRNTDGKDKTKKKATGETSGSGQKKKDKRKKAKKDK
jgi:hypothetical protein